MQSSNRGNQISRRSLLSGLAAATLCPAAAKPVGLSFGTYGLRMFSWEEALELVTSIGYDGVEIALMPGWPTEPKLLSNSERIRLRRTLGDLGLELPALAENLWTLHPTQSHQDNLDLLRRAIALGADLSPGKPLSEPQVVRRHAATDLGAACAGWLGPSLSGRKSGR